MRRTSLLLYSAATGPLLAPRLLCGTPCTGPRWPATQLRRPGPPNLATRKTSSRTEASVEAFLKDEMFSGGSVPKFEQTKGKKPTSVNHTAATSSTAASAVDLVDEDDDHLDMPRTTAMYGRQSTPRSPSPRISWLKSVLPRQRRPPLRKPLLPHTRLLPKPLARSRKRSACSKSLAVVRWHADPTDEAYFAALPLFEVELS